MTRNASAPSSSRRSASSSNWSATSVLRGSVAMTQGYVASPTVESAVVCLPTYNERENIEPMLRALEPLGVRVLIVDDNSPDGTENWGAGRRFVSIGGSWYARVLLGVPIRDLTGGFKCYRRAVLERIDLAAVRSKGYAFQIETTYRALRAGFRAVEVPIRFADRTAGHSKMSRAIVLEAVARVPALR